MQPTWRIRLAVRSDGLRGTLRKSLRWALGRVVSSEDHVWLAIDLDGERPRLQLPAELTLRRMEAPERELLEQIPNVVPAESRARLLAGNDLWMVLEGEQLLFSCSIFRERAPAIAAAGGWLRLPADTVCVEDSVTAPGLRRRNIASAAVASIADALAAGGKRWLITKVAVENEPSLRAAEKVGFERVALMHFTRRGTRSRVWLDALEHPHASLFVERIEAALRPARSRRGESMPEGGSRRQSVRVGL